MKKTLLTSLLVVCLSGCSARFGQIECKTIKVIQDGKTVFSGVHSEHYMQEVYEFRDAFGNAIYTDRATGWINCGIGDPCPRSGPSDIKLYESKESSKYTKYVYERQISYVETTRNYYLDLRTRTVETEFIYHEPSESISCQYPFSYRQEAYECAKKCYYHLDPYYKDTIAWSDAIVVYLDEIQEGLEYHTLETFDETVEFEYTELK